MAPDLGYHIHQVGFATFAHTLPGTVLAAVPIGLMFLIIFYLVRRPVCYIFPQPHRAALLPLCGPFPRGLKRWLIILLSLLIGVWTHTFWDAWTHDEGWFVKRVPALQQPLFRVGATVVVTMTLDQLATGGYVGREDARHLSEAYRWLRTVEHRLQLHRLRRTHLLPPDDDLPAVRRVPVAS